MIELPLVWRLVLVAVAFGTLPAVVLVGWVIEWWAGSSPYAVLLRSHLCGRRAQARRAARRITRFLAGAGRGPDRPVRAACLRRRRVSAA